MTGAGRLDRRFSFEKRNEQQDGYGNAVAGWVLQFNAWGGLKYLKGGEDVLAARLEARQPAILTLRNSPNSRQITAEWRAVGSDGTVYAFRETPRRTDDRLFLEALVEAGVAA